MIQQVWQIIRRSVVRHVIHLLANSKISNGNRDPSGCVVSMFTKETSYRVRLRSALLDAYCEALIYTLADERWKF
jgi:hypothetical protein